jgi:predicted short-subunit dehydrogenase-like oxidoreductase (DUF2520 family)
VQRSAFCPSLLYPSVIGTGRIWPYTQYKVCLKTAAYFDLGQQFNRSTLSDPACQELVTGKGESNSAILRGMTAKPRIAIVGAGNLGRALAFALFRSGYLVDAVIARTDRASLRKARSLSKAGGGIAVRPAEINSDVLWFCVPDREISNAARELAGKKTWKGRVALHSSGALTSDELEALRQCGAAVASVHPLMTFVRGSCPSLVDIPFAIEGDAQAARAARRIVRDLGGRSYPIRKQHKLAYHAWGMFASPLLTALLATTEHAAAAAGVRGKTARRRMLPILQQTLANYANLGPAASFSGPIIRGDVETVSQHLHVISEIPAVRDVYLALAKAALAYLPVKNRRKLEKILQWSRND